MSLDQQPARTGFDTDPPRGLGERIAVIAGVLVTALAVAGIAFIVTNDNEPAVAPSPAPSVEAQPSIGPSQEPAAQTPADLAAAEATVRYEEFIRVQDQVAQSGYENLDAYATVAIAPEYTQLVLEARRFADQRLTGDTEIVSVAVDAVVLPDAPDVRPKVTLRACLDVSQVDVLDSGGTSVVAPDRPDRAAQTVLLEKFEPGTEGAEAGGWFVAEVQKRGEPC